MSDIREALQEAVEYLNGDHGQNSIGAGSILHRKMQAALSANGGQADRLRKELADMKRAFSTAMEVAEFPDAHPAPPSVAVPEGWKLVPVEPTQAMLARAVPAAVSLVDRGPEQNEQAHIQAELYAGKKRQEIAHYYRAMVAAAPSPDYPGDANKMVAGHIPDAGKPGWNEITKMIQEFVSGYEYTDGEGGYYTPTDWQRHMIEDAIHGVLSEVPLQPAAPSVPENEEIKRAMVWAMNNMTVHAKVNFAKFVLGRGGNGDFGDCIEFFRAYARLRTAGDEGDV